MTRTRILLATAVLSCLAVIPSLATPARAADNDSDSLQQFSKASQALYNKVAKSILHESVGRMIGMHDLLREFQPDLVASTYPVFGYVMEKIQKANPAMRKPFYTIITDSTMINQTWYRYPCDGSIVADEPTAQVLRRDGVDHSRIHTLGFPVGLEFDDFLPAPPPGDGRWRTASPRLAAHPPRLMRCNNLACATSDSGLADRR